MKKKGFTLMEMIIVIGIIGLLLIFLIPSIKGYAKTTKTAVLRADFENVYKAMDSALIAEGESFSWYTEGTNAGLSFSTFGGIMPDYITTAQDNFLKNINDFMPKNAKILIVDEMNIPSYISKYDCFYSQGLMNADFVGENFGFLNEMNIVDRVELYEGENIEDFGYNAFYTRDDGETIGVTFLNCDDDSSTYSVIFVHNGDYTEEDGVWKYSTTDVDIILFNEGYYTVNGGELIESTWVDTNHIY